MQHTPPKCAKAHSISTILLILLSIAFSLNAESKQVADEAYVGVLVCKSCHEQSYKKWQNSDHDWAMKPAEVEFVLGNFQDEHFEHFDQKSRFFTRDDKFFVETDNAQGELETFEVAYTFGHYPLQQYLVDVGDGRLQALLTAWDSRPAKEGGQRWFHLYPNDKVDHEDPLHWTGAYFNWNSRCADCHSTNLQRHYLDKTHGYETTWSEVNVACEACHGPGAKHAEEGDPEFIASLKNTTTWLPGNHHTAEGTIVAQNTSLSPQINRCARCHSRRTMTGKPSGNDFFDDHNLALINSPLYYPDGQILDEVFVLGSFMQSKMFKAGVTCTNCHDPHDLQLIRKGNNLCLQCHKPSVFESTQHHHHKPESEGAQCVNCHMPDSNYMVVDPRRDHSFKIPRPDLSAQHKLPNACGNCHKDKDWVSKVFKSWFKDKALPLSPSLLVTGSKELMDIVNNDEENAIVIATALSRLAEVPDQEILELAIVQMSHVDAIVRVEAVKLMRLLSAEARLAYLLPLIRDPIKSVRLEVARLLVASPYFHLSVKEVQRVEHIISEYRETLQFHRDTAAGQLNIGLLALSEGDSEGALQSYKRALKIEPKHLGALLNLADLLRSMNLPGESIEMLVKAFEYYPESADVHHALGLARIREKDYENALLHLKLGFELQTSNHRYAYVYFVALDSQGQTTRAIELMEQHYNPQELSSELRRYLAHLYQKTGQLLKARKLNSP